MGSFNNFSTLYYGMVKGLLKKLMNFLFGENKTIETIVERTQECSLPPTLINVKETEGIKYIVPVGDNKIILTLNTYIRAYGHKRGDTLNTYYMEILDNQKNILAEIPFDELV